MADHADGAIIHGQRTLLAEAWRLVDDLARWREAGGYCHGGKVSNLHAGTVIDDLIALRRTSRIGTAERESSPSRDDTRDGSNTVVSGRDGQPHA